MRAAAIRRLIGHGDDGSKNHRRGCRPNMLLEPRQATKHTRSCRLGDHVDVARRFPLQRGEAATHSVRSLRRIVSLSLMICLENRQAPPEIYPSARSRPRVAADASRPSCI